MAEVQIPQLHQKTMNSRYPPKNILEIRGYSGTSKNSTTLIDKPASKLSNYESQSFIRINTNDNLKLMDKLVDFIENIPSKSWNEESNEGWTSTGVTSDRSSVYSIDDGDFDKEASRKVNNQLREIEAILYEQNSSKRPILNECKEWLEKFPHLRVLGHNVQSIPKEEPVQFIESKTTASSPKSFGNTPIASDRFSRKRELSDITFNTNFNGLNINGSSMQIQSVDSQDPKLNTELKFLEEEIFEKEGNYEELLAYDNREDEFLLENNKILNMNKRRRRSLPPISPKAAMKDIVSNLLFDHIWSEVINNSSEIIKKYAKTINSEFSDSVIHEKTPVQLISINSQQNKESIQNTHLSNLIPKTTNIQFNRSSIDTQELVVAPTIPGVSRDNSIFLQASKVFNTGSNRNDLINSSINETLDQITSLENFLKIKQFKNNHNNNKTLMQTSRLGSGSNRRVMITRKRFYEKLPTEIINDKNIFIHGAAVTKPSHIIQPEVKITTSYLDDDEENEYYDATVSLSNANGPNNTNIGSGGNSINYYSLDTDNFIDDSNSIANIIITNSINNNKKQLPPIETSSSTTLKKPSGFRISSAMNSKQYKDRSDRPMTTTATRIDNLFTKRSTTPLVQSINSKFLKSSNLSANIQITGVKFNNDDNNQKETVTSVNTKSLTMQPYQPSLLYNNQNQRKSINRDLQNLRITNR